MFFCCADFYPPDVSAALPDVACSVNSPATRAWTADEPAGLTHLFERYRLREVPGNRSQRLVVSERPVREFQPGLRYDEHEISRRLHLFHPDYTALRRYLADEGQMSQPDCAYRRPRGRFGP